MANREYPLATNFEENMDINLGTQQEYWNTKKIAEIYGVVPDTVRRNLCVRGNFMGLLPLKLPNGRLLWPAVTPKQLIER